MSTSTERIPRGDRAGKRARLVPFLDALLFVPAVIFLISGHYSSRPPGLYGTLFILMIALAIIRWGLKPRHRNSRDDIAAFLGGFGALTAVFALVEQTGPLSGVVYPAIYALIAFLVSFNRRWVSAGLVSVALVFELTLWVTAGEASGRTFLTVSTHIGLIVLFSGLHLLFDVMGRQRRPKLDMAAHRSDADSTRAPVEEPVGDDGFEVVEAALSLIGTTLKADTTLLLELDRLDDVLRVVASVPSTGDHTEIDARAGIAGSVLQTRQPLIANRLRANFPGGLPKPDGALPRHVLAAPVGRGQRLRGVLLAYRSNGELFGDVELKQTALAGRLLNASLGAHIQVERVIDAHYDLERFFEASRLLNSALTPDEVYRSANKALGKIVDFELSAITWIEEPEGKHVLVHASGCNLDKLIGSPVPSERSLAAMVVKNGHYLPLGCEYRPGSAPIVSPKESLTDVHSLIVLPLRVQDRVQGTLAVGAVEMNAFFDRRRGMMEVIANQVAVALANARTYARVQEMATVDALTGLDNRRAFHKRLDEALARSIRSKKTLSLVLMDIDHFKVINDTYGHPCGDEVLRELGATVRSLLRRTDAAARYGGEEFALILEVTSSAGALVMAERLRQQTAELEFTGPDGTPFSITLSLGIAAYPLDADNAAMLVQRADEALYESKHNGRNQSRLAQQLRPAPSEAITDLAGIEVPPSCSA